MFGFLAISAIVGLALYSGFSLLNTKSGSYRPTNGAKIAAKTKISTITMPAAPSGFRRMKRQVALNGPASRSANVGSRYCSISANSDKLGLDITPTSLSDQ